MELSDIIELIWVNVLEDDSGTCWELVPYVLKGRVEVMFSEIESGGYYWTALDQAHRLVELLEGQIDGYEAEVDSDHEIVVIKKCKNAQKASN